MRKVAQETTSAALKQAIVDCWQPFMTVFLPALRKCPLISRTVYRAVYIEGASAWKECYKPGRPVRWSGFTSTSTCPAQAWDVAVKSCEQAGGSRYDILLFSIRAVRGRQVACYSQYAEEEEVLLEPLSAFQAAASEVVGFSYGDVWRPERAIVLQERDQSMSTYVF